METRDLSIIAPSLSVESDAAQRSVSEVFDDCVHRYPDRIALRTVAADRTPEWTYDELAERVAATSGAFADLETGDRVVLALPGGADFVIGFLAVLQAGGLPVPIYLPSLKSPQRYLARAHHILRDCEPAAVYTIPELTDAIAQDSGTAGIPVCIPTDRGTGVTAVSRRPEDPAFLQYSSGSTGRPKGVVNTHASILRQIEVAMTTWRSSDPVHTVSWLPLYHDMGMFWGVLSPLLTGGTTTLIAPHDFVREPRIWLETVAAVRGNWIAGPDFGYRRCVQAFDAESAATLDLSCLRLATNGAEPVRPDTIREFTEHFAQAGLGAEVMAPQYGLAEAGLGVSGTLGQRRWGQTDFDAAELARGHAVAVTGEIAGRRVRTLVSCGDSALGWDLRIVDPDSGEVLPDGRVGEIWVGGSGLPQGYWRRPQDTEAVFRARTADGSGPFLRTGDAAVRSAGELYVCGRYRDLLIIGGKNHFPNDLEATAESAECGIARGGVCAVQPDFGDLSWTLVAETDRSVDDLDDLARNLRHRILAEHETTPDRVVWVPRRSLPLTTSGKIRRREVVDRLAAGTLPVVYESAVAAAAGPQHDELTEHVAGLLGVHPDRLDEDGNLVECGLTSMMTADVMTWAAARGSRPAVADLYRTPTLAAWRQLLERTEGGAATAVNDPGPGENPRSGVAMTALQRAYSIGRLPDLPLGGVECLAYLEFQGRQLDQERLQYAVGRVHRHPALRCLFLVDQDAVLRDGDAQAPTVITHDVRDNPQAGRDEIRKRMLQKSIDIGLGLNWAVTLSSGHGDDWVVHLVFSLAALDVAAIGVVLDELAATYSGDLDGIEAGEPARSIAEVREHVAVSSPRRTAERQHDSPPLLPGPDLAGLAEVVTDDVATTTFRHDLSAQTWADLDARAKELGVSTAALVLTVYERALRRWSERDDFCIVVAALDIRGTESVVTDRTVAYAHRSFGGADFEQEVLAAAADLQRRIIENRDILTESHEAQAAGDSVAASRCVFTYAVETTAFSSLVLDVFGRPRSWGQTPQSAIDCRLFRVDRDAVEVAFDVRRAAIPEHVAEAIFELFTQNLAEVAATGTPRTVLPLEQEQFRAALNASPPQAARLLYDGFRAHAAARPTAVAVAESSRFPEQNTGDSTSGMLTYGELDRRALAFAGRIAAQAEPGSVVAVQLPRGVDQVVALLGTLYAGCVYLPLSLDAGPARVARIRERSRWSIHITTEFSVSNGATAPLENPVPRNVDDLAYIIFTSGSTGEPKGVAITHGAASNTITDVNERHRVGPADTLLGVSGIDFDLSVYDVFGALAAGARLITLQDSETRDPFRWGEVVRLSGATIWNSVPLLLEMLVAANEKLETLRAFLISGDKIALDLPARSRALAPGSTFVAMGGATEASIWSNEHVIRDGADLDQEWSAIPYGRPLGGQRYRVVDAHHVDRPDGCVGELLIGGAGVAHGYYRDPDRTAAAFVDGADGQRWYRTGDLGYWQDGLLFFVGRRDTQVKIRGHRVECGETESRLQDHPCVNAAVVVPIRDRSALGALYVPTDESAAPAAAELTAHLEPELPWYMVPAVFRAVAELPMTANGKVDRHKSATLMSEDDDTASTDAQTDDGVVSMVTDAWAHSLRRSVAADSNYFALGGDSLSATQMCARLREQGLNADLTGLFRAPVLAEFAEACRRGGTPDETTQAANTEVDTGADWRELAAADNASLSSLGLQQWCRWLWRHELGLRNSTTEVADDADFFALGGDSLTAARLCADLRSSGVAATVATLFRHPRFDDFWHRCSLVEEDTMAATDSAEDSAEDAFDLTPLQLAYALGSDGIPGVVRTSACVAVIIRSDDPSIPPRWSAALDNVVARHEVLRLIRSDDWRQRVVPDAAPEFTEIPFDLSNEQFRDVLRRTSVDSFDAPAVRAFVRRDHPEELGLVFNYLALDSLSVAAILRDLAAVVTSGGVSVRPEAAAKSNHEGQVNAAIQHRPDRISGIHDIGPFRRYARSQNGGATDTVIDAPPAPRIPTQAIPDYDAVFDSKGQVFSADTVQRIRGIARSQSVTLNSVLLHTYGSALAAATGQLRLTINVPTAARPVDAPEALGQFTDLVLCECGEGVSVRDIHENLGAAMAGAGAVTIRRAPERQPYPVVFTSLLGSPLAEALAEGIVRTVWTHTRTPGVLIDCQISPTENHGIEVRWDYPREIVSRSFVDTAFTDFTARLLELANGTTTQAGATCP